MSPLDVLKRYEVWEANLINEPKAWAGMAELPTLTQELWDELLEIQGLRNAALSPSSSAPEGIDWEEIETLRQDYRSRPTHSATRLIAAIDVLKAEIERLTKQRDDVANDLADSWESQTKTIKERDEARAQLRGAVKEERRACALIAYEDLAVGPNRVAAEMRFDGGASEAAAKRIAKAIEARSEAENG